MAKVVPTGAFVFVSEISRLCFFIIYWYYIAELSCRFLEYITFNNQVDESHDNLLSGSLSQEEALDCLAFNSC